MHANVIVSVDRSAEYTLAILRLKQQTPSDEYKAWLKERNHFKELPAEYQEAYSGPGDNEDLLSALPFVINKMMQAKSKATMQVSGNAKILERICGEQLTVGEWTVVALECDEVCARRISAAGVISESQLEKAISAFMDITDDVGEPVFNGQCIVYAKWRLPEQGTEASDKEQAHMVFTTSRSDYYHVVAIQLAASSVCEIRKILEM